MGIRPGTEGILALTDEWTAEFKLKPNEEMVIANNFDSPVGASKIGNQMHIRILPVISANTLATTDQGTGLAAGNYHTGTILEITVDPTFAYGIVEIPDHMVSKLSDSDSGAMKAGYRKQLLASLNTYIDEIAGELASGASAQKGAPSNFDKSLLLDAQGTLATNAKEFIKLAQGTPMFLCYHPSQVKHVNAISEITAAYARGDSANPNVKGVVIDAWGMSMAESGNIEQDQGVTYNMLHAKQGYVLAYNVKPKLKEPQDYEFAVRLPAFCEFGVAEVFDEACVAIKSPA